MEYRERYQCILLAIPLPRYEDHDKHTENAKRGHHGWTAPGLHRSTPFQTKQKARGKSKADHGTNPVQRATNTIESTSVRSQAVRDSQIQTSEYILPLQR